MSEIFQLNVVALYFLYGLSFYTMGVAIALQYRSYSSFRLAYSLSLLAAFGVLHGLSEWGSVFIPAGVPNLGIFPTWKAIALQRLLHAVSLFFLFCFGVKLIFDSRGRNYWWFALPAAAFLTWLVQFAFFIPLLGSGELMHWLLISESWSRYILAFPAGIFTAYGLILQIPEAAVINDRSVLRNLWTATSAFVLFAIFSGLVVSQEIGWLGRMVNVENFRLGFGLPIEVFRTATAFLATWSITRMLAIFDLEKQRQVAESRRLETVCRERERFARDLHDDVIQSIYAAGLELQTATHFMDKDPESAARRVNLTVKRLNEVIQALRTYIQGLEANDGEQDLNTLFIHAVEQFCVQTGLDIDLQVSNGGGNHTMIKLEDWQQISQIIREALHNIAQHAQVSQAQVDVQLEGSLLKITVKDKGCGISSVESSLSAKGGKGMGLRNMQMRAKQLGGDLQLFSQKGEGTRLVINVPM